MAGRIFFVGLALYGAAEAAIHFIRWWVDTTMPGDAVVGLGNGEHAWLSPDGSLKAVPFLQTGGGGLDPYCKESVAVAPSSVADGQAWSRDMKIVIAGCNAITGVEWIARNRLQVSLDPNRGADGINALMLKRYAANGQVTVSYVFPLSK